MLSTLDYANLVISVGVIAGFGYVAYLALALRATLGFGLYRKQAVGLALVALTILGGYLGNYAYYYPTYLLLSFLGGLLFYAQAFVLLYWVDSSILAARRTDPLVRDVLGWSRVRPFAWTVAVATAVVTLLTLLWYHLVYPNGGAPAAVDTIASLLSGLFPLPIYIAAAAGVLVLPIAARRSKDATLRTHLLWFFVFVVIQLALPGGIGTFLLDPVTAQLVAGIALLLGFYPLYLSAKRLIPLYKFSMDEASGSVEPVTPAHAPSIASARTFHAKMRLQL